MSFKSDLINNSTSIFPVVKIGGDWYSTNSVTIIEYTPPSPFEVSVERYCKPLILSIPTIKESVDIDARNFKISNVTLTLSNMPFSGERFSDQLLESSLINIPVTIFFKSPSTNYYYTINHNNTGNQMHEVYSGIIRSIKHDDKKITISLEDVAAKKAHKDLPQKSLGSGESILTKYRNKPYPMVYGEVDRSPVIFDGNKGIIEAEEIIGIQDLQDDIFSKTLSGVQIEGGKGTYTVPKTIKTMSNSEYIYGAALEEGQSDVDTEVLNEGENQWTEVSDREFTLTPNGMDAEKGLQLEAVFPPETTLTAYEDNTQWEGSFDGFADTDNKSDIHDRDLSTFVEFYQDRANAVFSLPDFINSGHRIPICFFTFRGNPSEHDLASDISEFETSINNIIIPTEYIFICRPEDLDVVNSHPLGLSGGHQAYTLDTLAEAGIDFRLLFEFGGDNNGASDINFIDASHDNFIESENYHFQIAPFITTSTNQEHGHTLIGFFMNDITGVNCDCDIALEYGYGEVEGKLKEAWSYARFDTKKTRDKKFFVNVKGRKNNHNQQFNELNNPYLSDGELIENPIDIIYDLVRRELGHDAIDEDEYQKVKEQHKLQNGNDWKFGFSIFKETNSKKLIQEIAKSTKCFPAFKNNGKFGFNAIQDNYSDSDFNEAFLIEENDIIGYSFKKTKPENIYSKVKVRYKKDYGEGSYLKETVDMFLEGDNFYNLDTYEDAYLKFESDYIRDEKTAQALGLFLYEQHKNDHLLLSVTLPLRYISLEVGQKIKLEKLLNGVAAYGIDYTVSQDVNGQVRYPLFMITSIQKGLQSIKVECMQLHHLNGDVDLIINPVGDIIPPQITITGDSSVGIGTTFDLPVVTVSDDDTDVTITESWSNNFIFNNLGDGTAEALSAGNTTLQVTATDSSGNSSLETFTVYITPNPSGATGEFIPSGWIMNNIHPLYQPRDVSIPAVNASQGGAWDISQHSNSFWFAFNFDSPVSASDIFLGDFPVGININADEYSIIDATFANSGSAINFQQILQVTGMQDPSDNGLYRAICFYTIKPANWDDSTEAGFMYEWVNHFALFQKINMDKNRFINGEVVTEQVGSFTEEEGLAGAWLSNVQIDTSHVISSTFVENEQEPTAGFDGFTTDDPPIIDIPDLNWSGGVTTPASPITLTNVPFFTQLTSFQKGDANMDTFINGPDVSFISAFVTSSQPDSALDEVQGQLMDFDDSGFISMQDAIDLANFILGAD
tara:strand:- start:709 stop:4419 length:3711 start_codon:yes stop_codon:yes gene_type:complete